MEQQGGGRRVQRVDRHSIFQEMFQRIVDVFFPNGFNKKRKHISKYKHCLGDYALQEITEIMYPVFTLEKYIECNPLKPVKFTLLTCDKRDKKIRIGCFHLASAMTSMMIMMISKISDHFHSIARDLP